MVLLSVNTPTKARGIGAGLRRLPVRWPPSTGQGQVLQH